MHISSICIIKRVVFILFDEAIREKGLIDSMHVIKKKSLHIARKITFVNLMILAKKMNLVGFVNSTCILATRLNYLMIYLLD